jgi:ABC-type amino acid transport substrate-binding protein
LNKKLYISKTALFFGRLWFVSIGWGVFGLSALANNLPPVTDRLTQIAQRGAVHICIWPNYYAITWLNPKTNRLQGLDIDMANALAHDLQVRSEFVNSTFASFVDDVRAGRCDIAMMGTAVTPARQALVNFSEPYLVSGFYGVTTLSHPTVKQWADIDKTGHIVMVLKGTVQESAMRQRLRAATLRVAQDVRERESDVQSGRADVFIADYPYTRRVLAFADWARVLVPVTPVEQTPYAYAVAPDDAPWLNRVNAFVRAVKRDGRLEASARQHDLLPILVRR